MPAAARRVTVLIVASPGPHSGLIVEVPEAEPAVARHRERLDATAPLGVPAHITVLFPFLPPGRIHPSVLAELEHLFAAAGRFSFRLERTGWFGEDVLWLAPADPGPFRTLTLSVYEAFPGYPPFEGEFDEIVPHLTVGHGHRVDDLRAAETAVREHLPIEAHATAVSLMTQRSPGGRWARATAFHLG